MPNTNDITKWNGSQWISCPVPADGQQGEQGPQGDPGQDANVGNCWPVGSVFISVVSTNPATLLGIGTWNAIATGKVLVGLDSGDTDFDSVEETGGAKTVASAGSNATESSHTHTYTQVPNHVHGVSTILRTATTGSDTTQVTNAQDTSSTKDTTRKTDNPDGGVATGTTNAGSSHGHAFTGSATSVVQPYFVVYMWKRVS